jgi:hypothetical protein
MCSKYIKSLLLFLLFFFTISIYPKFVSAVTLTITDYPTTITRDEFPVSVEVSGAEDHPNYLRIDLYKEGTGIYFGETFNNTDWVSGSNGTSYYPIIIYNGAAQATFQGRLGSPGSEYDGPGMYKLRVRRYTESGSQASDSVTPVNVEITVPIEELLQPTPTPAPTEVPGPTDTPEPTVTPTPTKTTTSTPKTTASAKASSTPNDTETSDSTGEILGIRDEINKTPQGTSSAETTKSGFPFLALFFILTGVLFIGGAIFALLKKAKKEYNLKSAET